MSRQTRRFDDGIDPFYLCDTTYDICKSCLTGAMPRKALHQIKTVPLDDRWEISIIFTCCLTNTTPLSCFYTDMAIIRKKQYCIIDGTRSEKMIKNTCQNRDLVSHSIACVCC